MLGRLVRKARGVGSKQTEIEEAPEERTASPPPTRFAPDEGGENGVVARARNAAARMVGVNPRDNRLMRLVDDMLLPESMPSGWLCKFDEASDTWMYGQESMREISLQHPLLDYYLGAVFMDKGGYKDLLRRSRVNPPTPDECDAECLRLGIRLNEDMSVQEVGALSLRSPLLPGWEMETTPGAQPRWRNTVTDDVVYVNPMDPYFLELRNRRRRAFGIPEVTVVRALINFATMAADSDGNDDRLVKLWRRLCEVMHDVATATMEVTSAAATAEVMAPNQALRVDAAGGDSSTRAGAGEVPKLSGAPHEGQPSPRQLALTPPLPTHDRRGASRQGSTAELPLRGAAQSETYCGGSGGAGGGSGVVRNRSDMVEAGSLVPSGKLAVASALKASVQAMDLDALMPAGARAGAGRGALPTSSGDGRGGRFGGRSGGAEGVESAVFFPPLFEPISTPDGPAARARAEALVGAHVEVLEAAHGMLRCLPPGALSLLASLPKDWPQLLQTLPPNWANLLRSMPRELPEILDSLPPQWLATVCSLPPDWADRLHQDKWVEMLEWLPDDWPTVLRAYLDGRVPTDQQQQQLVSLHISVVDSSGLTPEMQALLDCLPPGEPAAFVATLAQIPPGSDAWSKMRFRDWAEVVAELPDDWLERLRHLLAHLPEDWEAQLEELALLRSRLPADWEAQLQELAHLQAKLPLDMEDLLRALELLRRELADLMARLPAEWEAQLAQLVDLLARLPEDWEAQLARLARLPADWEAQLVQLADLMARLPADWEAQLAQPADLMARLPADWEAQLAQLAGLLARLPADWEAQLAELADLRSRMPGDWEAQLAQLVDLLAWLPVDWEAQLAELAHLRANLPTDREDLLRALELLQHWEGQLRELALLRASLPADWAAQLAALVDLLARLPSDWEVQLRELAVLRSRLPADWEAQLAQLAALLPTLPDGWLASVRAACGTGDPSAWASKLRVGEWAHVLPGLPDDWVERLAAHARLPPSFRAQLPSLPAIWFDDFEAWQAGAGTRSATLSDTRTSAAAPMLVTAPILVPAPTRNRHRDAASVACQTEAPMHVQVHEAPSRSASVQELPSKPKLRAYGNLNLARGWREEAATERQPHPPPSQADKPTRSETAEPPTDGFDSTPVPLEWNRRAALRMARDGQLHTTDHEWNRKEVDERYSGNWSEAKLVHMNQRLVMSERARDETASKLLATTRSLSEAHAARAAAEAEAVALRAQLSEMRRRVDASEGGWLLSSRTSAIGAASAVRAALALASGIEEEDGDAREAADAGMMRRGKSSGCSGGGIGSYGSPPGALSPQARPLTKSVSLGQYLIAGRSKASISPAPSSTSGSPNSSAGGSAWQLPAMPPPISPSDASGRAAPSSILVLPSATSKTPPAASPSGMSVRIGSSVVVCSAQQQQQRFVTTCHEAPGASAPPLQPASPVGQAAARPDRRRVILSVGTAAAETPAACDRAGAPKAAEAAAESASPAGSRPTRMTGREVWAERLASADTTSNGEAAPPRPAAQHPKEPLTERWAVPCIALPAVRAPLQALEQAPVLYRTRSGGPQLMPLPGIPVPAPRPQLQPQPPQLQPLPRARPAGCMEDTAFSVTARFSLANIVDLPMPSALQKGYAAKESVRVATSDGGGGGGLGSSR
ncbi:hypothetical protein FOA52_007097 [Chlamydomonas sp. UWO 241]|nr:hypothetical protein FOA52_007097 [Chlamydomonas sp. UWO 241]